MFLHTHEHSNLNTDNISFGQDLRIAAAAMNQKARWSLFSLTGCPVNQSSTLQNRQRLDTQMSKEREK